MKGIVFIISIVVLFFIGLGAYFIFSGDTGTVVVTSNREGDTVYINNELQSLKTPYEFTLPIGQYKIRIERSGHIPYQSNLIEIRKDHKESIDAKLIEGYGILLIKANQPKNLVYINGKPHESTPVSIEMLMGSYEIRVEKAGYDVFRKTVELGNKKTVTVTANLVREGMVYIPAGEFTMGSMYDGTYTIEPHQVYLDAYYLDKYEVTVKEYKKCIEAGKCEPANEAILFGKRRKDLEEDCNFNVPNRDNHPVNCVNWLNAKKYCNFKNKRLPTEAEWERAATWKNKKKYAYPSGRPTISCDDAVVFIFGIGSGCGKKSTWEIGSRPIEINGTFDMTGNVKEWVSDWYSEYTAEFQNNPKGPSYGKYRIHRGGTWGGNVTNHRGDDRFTEYQDEQSPIIGIRCAASL